MRVAIINTHPIQYYAPLYAYLSKDQDVDINVFYLTDLSLRGSFDDGFKKEIKWDIDLLSGYSYKFVGRNCRTVTPGGFFSLVVPELFLEILRGKFDAVLVYGYAHASTLVAIAAARLSGSKVFFRADTNGLLAKSRRHPILKQLYVKGVLAACDTMLTIGARNREFYRWMGVPERKMVHVPFVVDNDRFGAASGLSETERLELRRWLGITDKRPALLFVSKFLRRKNPHLVIEAAGQLAKAGRSLHLVMAGSGEMESGIESVSRQISRVVRIVSRLCEPIENAICSCSLRRSGFSLSN